MSARPASRMGSGRRRRRGQALVEFALVAPFFFLLLFSIIEFGRYVYYVQILNNAAREGARYAIVHGHKSLGATGPPDQPSGQAVIDRVVNYSVGVIGGSGQITVVPQWPDGDPNPSCTSACANSRGNRVIVTVTYPFDTLIPLVPLPQVPITGGTTLVINCCSN